MTKPEKVWGGDVKMQYPKQWIVFVEIEYTKNPYKDMGYVYFVTPDRKEAFEKAQALGKSRGNKCVLEGFDDTPQIGGLLSWIQ